MQKKILLFCHTVSAIAARSDKPKDFEIGSVFMTGCVMKKISFLLAGIILSWTVGGAEKLIRDFKKDFAKLPENMRSETAFVEKAPSFLLSSEKETKRNVVSRSFYFFHKKDFPVNRGKKVTVRMKVRKLSGPDKLSLTLRIMGSKAPIGGSNSRVDFPADGRWHEVKLSGTLPSQDPEGNAFHNSNIQFVIYATGRQKTSWLVDELKVFEGGESDLVPVKGESLGIAQIRNGRSPLALVKNGKAAFDIVLGENPNDIALFAAEELQEHIFKATGSRPAILRGKKKNAAAIWIGDTQLSRRYGIQPDMFSPDNWCVVRVGNDIIISGGDGENVSRKAILSRSIIPLGTLFASYEFLERCFNVRWFWPGKLGTLVPETMDLSVGKLFYCGSPDYFCRAHFFEHSREKDLPNDVLYRWHRRIRSGGSDHFPIANHSFRDWSKKYADKPEIFALQANGKRKVSSFEGTHLCLTNPETLKLAAAELISNFKKRPHLKFLAVMPGDSNILHACKCPKCSALYQPQKGPTGIHSNATWDFVNKVARLVAKACPGKFVKCASYGSHKLPPDFPLESNVAVTLCLDPVPQGSRNCREGWEKQIRAWRKTGAALYVWEYWDVPRIKKGTFGSPAVYARQLKELYMLDRGTVRGRVIELAHHDYKGEPIRAWADWILDMPAVYIAGKLMWDISTDVDDELERYCRDFFGPAEGEIREFYELMENAWMNSVWLRNGQVARDLETVWQKTYPGEFIDRIMEILRRGRKKCGDREPYASRMDKMLEFYSHVEYNSRLFRSSPDFSRNKDNVIRLRRTSAPAIDGRLDAGEWKDAVRVACSARPLGIGNNSFKTEFFLKQDGKNLYAAARAFPGGHPREINFPRAGGLSGRDAFLWTVDSVELLFANRKGERQQFIVAPVNMLFDAWWKKNIKKFDFPKGCAWNPPVMLATSGEAPEWTMEMAIPLDSLDFYTENGKKTLRVNLGRNHVYRKNKKDRGFRSESALWLATGGGFDKSDAYGTLVVE